MWIARAVYERLLEHKAMADWLRVRVNQLERERALLLQRALAVPIEAPELLREAPQMLPPRDVQSANGLPNIAGVDFEDIGDELAQSLGVFHDHEGRIRYRS